LKERKKNQRKIEQTPPCNHKEKEKKEGKKGKKYNYLENPQRKGKQKTPNPNPSSNRDTNKK